MEGCCEYTEQEAVDKRQGVVLQLGGLGVGLKTPHFTKQACYESHKKPRTWTDSLDKRPKRRNMDMTYGTWNIKNIYRAGSPMTV
jgi:hypothetical protein